MQMCILFLYSLEICKRLTPGAVATTRYGNKYKSRFTCWKIFLKREITCNASMSCRTSSPTLNIAACQTSGCMLRDFCPS